MLQKILLLLLVLLAATAPAQESATFDSSFNKRTEDPDGKYLREYLNKDMAIEVKDYHEGKLFRSGTFYGFTSLKEIDEYIWYQANGQYTKHRDLDTSNKKGQVTYYNKDGKPVEELYYVEDKKYYLQLWKDGEPRLTAGSGNVEEFNTEKNQKLVRIFRDSVELEHYTIRYSKNDTIHYLVHTHAYPKEGLARFSSVLASTIEYPKDLRKLGIEKKVIVEFVVDENGHLTEFFPDFDKTFSFEKNAIARLEKMPAWTPATFNGRNVKTRFRLPIIFLLR